MKRLEIFCFLITAIVIAGQNGLAQENQDVQAGSSKILRSDLRDEILQMAREDQAARGDLVAAMNEARKTSAQADSNSSQAEEAKKSGTTQGPIPLTGPLAKAMERVTAIDKRTQERMVTIVDELGWPGKSMVGEEAAHMAWLLVQHVDAHPEFQKKCLELMKSAAPGEVSGKDIAYLTDRTLINSGQLQIYGTQLNEEFEPSPLADPDNVDRRRSEVGLGPLAEYVETTKNAYLNPGK